MAKKERQSLRVKTPECRLSYPHLGKAHAFKGKEDDPSQVTFNVTALFPKEDKKKLRPVIDAVAAAKESKFGTDKKKWPADLRTPFRDGDKESLTAEKEPKEGYAGHIFIKAKRRADWCEDGRHVALINEDGALLRDPAGNTVLSEKEIDVIFYPGCWVQLIVEPYGYNTSGNAGVAFGLVAVRKIRDDEPLSSGEPVDVSDFWDDAKPMTEEDMGVLSDEDAKTDPTFSEGSSEIKDDDIPF